MKNLLSLLLFFVIALSLNAQVRLEYAIVIHGGAGNISPKFISPEREIEIREKLSEALETGIGILDEGGTSMDAVEKVIRILEDSPLFNAGKGAVFNNAGKNELDACIMDGRTLNAGGITGVGDIKNPISAARMVMEKYPHVLLMGAGASDFASANGIEIVDSGYFHTEKRWGRIGDTPIIGAGNYANNNSCAVSGTGHGEFFMKYTVAHDISALMQYKGLSVEEAAREVVHEKLKPAGGSGGVICVDKYGNMAMEFNSTGMMRAWANSEGVRGVKVFE